MKIGDLVIITAKDHPWEGETGYLEKPATPGYGYDWVVDLKGDYLPSCGVSEHEVKVI